MEDVVGILMRHSEEGEMLERRAGGQTKGLLLKVSSLGAALRVTCMVAGRREWVPAPTTSPGEDSFSHPVNLLPSC